MNYAKFGLYIGERIERMTSAQQWRFFCGMLNGTNYVGGKENLDESDCSGVVSFALVCMGYSIRATADAFYQKLFIHNAAEHWDDPERILAVFCALKGEGDHYGVHRPAGFVTHVAPVIGEGVVLHAHGTTRLNMPVTSKWLYDYYKTTHRVEWREIDMGLLSLHSNARDLVHGIDAELLRLM